MAELCPFLLGSPLSLPFQPRLFSKFHCQAFQTVQERDIVLPWIKLRIHGENLSYLVQCLHIRLAVLKSWVTYHILELAFLEFEPFHIAINRD